MAEINFRNQEIKSILTGFVTKFLDQYKSRKDLWVSLSEGPDDRTRGEYFCSDGYLLDWWKRGCGDHVGFPEQYHAVPMVPLSKIHRSFEWANNYTKQELVHLFGAKASAVANYYPPGGYVGWHTNWNTECHQILLTWSDRGYGYFKYTDHDIMDSDKLLNCQTSNGIVKINDVPGWQARYYHFAPKPQDPTKGSWHCAYAGCDRFTLAFKFPNEMMRDMFIEELETP